MAGEDSWHYLDSTGSEFGPFPADTMRDWFSQGFFPIGAELPVRLPHWKTHVPLRLCYPDVTKAFVGRSAISEPDAAPAAIAGGPPGTQGPPGAMGQAPYSPEQFGGGGYYMMPGAGGMMQGMMPGMMPGMMAGGMQGGKGGMGYGMMGGAMMSGADMASLGRLSGRVKSFNAKQGFGFIECPQIHAMYGRDVFLHKAQIGDLKVGVEITFGVEPNKQGMPQARDVLTLDGKAPGPAPGGGNFQQSQGGKGGGQGKGGGKGGQGNRRKPNTDMTDGMGGGQMMAPMGGVPEGGWPAPSPALAPP